MPDHHPTFAPSSLPALAQCAQFRSGPAGEAAERGTMQHEYLAQILTSPQRDKALGLTGDETANVEWAAEYIQANKTKELSVEKAVVLLDDDFQEVTFGRLDAWSAPDLFDYKSGDVRNYREQMAAYAWASMDLAGIEEVRVHELYGRSRTVNVYRFTRDEARALVLGVRDRVAKNEAPTPCDYCGWCARAATCPALVERAQAVGKGRTDWEPTNWHSSEIGTAADMAKALKLARQLKAWCESVEHHARDMVFRDGKPLPGFKAQERQGSREVIDLSAAFSLCGMPQDLFLKCCKVGLGDLEVAYAEVRGMKKATAARELAERLSAVVRRGKSSQFLVAEKG